MGKQVKGLIGVMVGACLVLSAPTALGDEAGEQKALRAAESWLSLIDGGQYGRSWETASTLFRNATSTNDPPSKR